MKPERRLPISKYSEFTTNLSDPKCLLAALAQMGFEQVESHQKPQTLYDWHGQPRPEKAHVIIRRQHTGIGASNDIGFLKDSASGQYRAIISEYDTGAKFNDSWMGKLKQNYAEIRTVAQARLRGYKFLGKSVQADAEGRETVKLRFAAR